MMFLGVQACVVITVGGPICKFIGANLAPLKAWSKFAILLRCGIVSLGKR
jgi:hypothetical protein